MLAPSIKSSCPWLAPSLNSSFKTKSNLSFFDSLPALSLSQVDK